MPWRRTSAKRLEHNCAMSLHNWIFVNFISGDFCSKKAAILSAGSQHLLRLIDRLHPGARSSTFLTDQFLNRLLLEIIALDETVSKITCDVMCWADSNRKVCEVYSFWFKEYEMNLQKMKTAVSSLSALTTLTSKVCVWLCNRVTYTYKYTYINIIYSKQLILTRCPWKNPKVCKSYAWMMHIRLQEKNMFLCHMNGSSSSLENCEYSANSTQYSRAWRFNGILWKLKLSMKGLQCLLYSLSRFLFFDSDSDQLWWFQKV